MKTKQIKTANPFPGLRSFTEQEAHLFFGRTRSIQALCGKLKTTRFLAVVGTSGSGKSSLIRCGLIPKFYRYLGVSISENLQVISFKPSRDPIKSLAHALAALPNIPLSLKQIEAKLQTNEAGIIEILQTSKKLTQWPFLIYIDQFEELFRYSEQAKYKIHPKIAHFINLLLFAKKQNDLPIYVLFSMRSDFLGDCALYTGLPEAINEGHYLIPRMTKSEQQEVILKPIEQSGAHITPELVERLLNDLGNNPEQLPVLQHALMRTWNYWLECNDHEKPIDTKHYESIGGVEYALSQHADEAYEELTTERQRQICKILFQAITDRGSDSRGIRRPTSMGMISELANASLEEVAEVVEIFRKSSRAFLMPPPNKPLTADTMIDVAHESLMRIWTKLMEWVNEEVLSAETYMQLAKAAALYQENQSGLWRDPELQLALTWEEKQQPNVAWATRYDPSFERAIAFLHYSQEQRDFELSQKEAQQKKQLHRTRLLAAIFGMLTIFSIMATLYALIEQGQVQQSERKAQEHARIAEEKSLEAKKNEDKAKVASKEAMRNAVRAQKSTVQAEESAAEAERQAAIAHQHEKLAKERFLMVKQQKAELELNKSKLEKAITALEMAKEKEERLKVVAELRATKASKSALQATQKTLNALKEKQTADSLRHLNAAIAQAIQANRLMREGNPLVGATIALEAYKSHAAYHGSPHHPDIFMALSNAVNTVGDNHQRTFKAHEASIRAISMHSDNKTVATGDEKGVINIWNTHTGQSQTVTTKKQIRTLAYASNGDLVIGTVKGRLLLFPKNSKKRKPIVLETKQGLIHSLRIVRKNGKDYIFYASDLGMTVGMLNDRTFTPIGSLEQSNLNRMAVSQNGQVLALANTENVHFYQLNYQAIQLSKILGKPTTLMKSRVSALAISKDGSHLAIGCEKGFVAILDTRKRDFEKIFIQKEEKSHRSRITQLVFNSTTTQLASSSTDKVVKLWDVKNYLTEQEISLPPHLGLVWDIVYDATGHYLYSVSSDKLLRKWHTSSAELAKDLRKILKK